MVYLSITLGAGRCDIVKGHPGAGGRIATENVHTFENNPIWKDGRFVWDIERIYGEIVLGLKKAGKADYLSIVFAGEDFVFLDENGDIKGNVLSFLDKTTPKLEARPDEAYIFNRTGVRISERGMVYQLLSLKEKDPDVFEGVAYLLSLSDYLVYRLTGVMKHEYTWAAATGLVNPLAHDWDHEMIDGLALPVHLFTALSDAGTEVGTVSEDLSSRIGYAPVVLLSPSYAPAAEALAAPKEDECVFVLADDEMTAGVSDSVPFINDEAYTSGLSNEGSGNGTVRLVKKMPGLKILRKLSDESGISLSSLIEASRSVRLLGTVDLSLLADDKSVKDGLSELLGKDVESEVEAVAVLLFSLANSLKESVSILEKVSGKTFSSIAVAGSGVEYPLFMDILAMETGKPVIAGSSASASLGALISQMMRAGEIQLSSTTRAEFVTSYRRQ